MKLPGNEHFSLVDEDDERKVNCDFFTFPEEEYAQIPGEEDCAEADMLAVDEERCHIIHTLAGSHLLPVKFGAQATAALRSMRYDGMVQLCRHRPIAPGSRICRTVDVRLNNGRFRGWDFETDVKMTNEKMALLDTGRVDQQDIRINSAPVPISHVWPT